MHAQAGDTVECPYEGMLYVKRNDNDLTHVKFFHADEDFEVPPSDIFVLDSLETQKTF